MTVSLHNALTYTDVLNADKPSANSIDYPTCQKIVRQLTVLLED